MNSGIRGSKAANHFHHPAQLTGIHHRSRYRRIRQPADVAPVTGPFTPLTGYHSVLVVADIENLAYSARNLGLMVDFAMLATRLKASLNEPALHAVFSAPAADDRAGRLLSNMGWTPHHRPIIGRRANADTAIAFLAAALIAAMRAEVCVIGTGDGGLARDIAYGIRSAFKDCALIATMSLAGSTSRLLDARRTAAIDLNIEIGRDLMRPPRCEVQTLAAAPAPIMAN